MAGTKWGVGIFCLLLALMSASALVKVKVNTEDANLKETPEIGARTIAKLPLDMILQVEAKQGEWYKVTLDLEGRRLSGFIHEMLVTVVEEKPVPPPVKVEKAKEAPAKEEKAEAAKEPVAPVDKAQTELLADLELQLEKCRILIREERKFDEAVTLLSPLSARTLRIADRDRQLRMTAEIFLLKGMAQAGGGDDAAARMEFRNMFEVDVPLAKELTKNIYDAKIVGLLKQAEMGFLGLTVEYALEVVTVPAGAKVKVDGRDLGLSPAAYKTESSKALVEIEKEGYAPVREELVLSEKATRKEYRLEYRTPKMTIASDPPGARIFLDGRDIGKVTNLELPEISVGEHTIRLVKEFYADWEIRLKVAEGDAAHVVAHRLVGTSYAPSRKWGDPESSLLIRPAAIAVDKSGRVLVADESPEKVKVFSSSGEPAAADWAAAPELKALVRPGGLAVDGQGNVYITDSESHAVWTLNRSGRLELRWGDFGAGDMEFNTPTGIAADAKGDLYIVDSGNSRIKKHTSRGSLLKTWGGAGSENGHFLSPRAVAVSAAGDVFVLDSERVQRFTADGAWVAGWGQQGTGEGQFNNPLGLAVDAAGSVYVADTDNHRIQKFDGQGKLVCSWGAKGLDLGMLDRPCGIAIDDGGAIYVVERTNSRVQVFNVGSFALGASKR